VIDEPEYWDEFYQVLHDVMPFLWLDTFSFLNKYMEYYGFNLAHITWFCMFYFWPNSQSFEVDPTLQTMFGIWYNNVRMCVRGTHNAWFDYVYLLGCDRTGSCNKDDMIDTKLDDMNTMTLFRPAPNYSIHVDCPELPLDPFSVWADQWLAAHPQIEDLINIDPQTADPQDFENRCWSDMVWQRSPYNISCGSGNPVRVGPGVDYLIAYWVGRSIGRIGPND